MMKYYSAIKRKEFMAFAATWMRLGTIILSEVTQEQKTHRVGENIYNLYNSLMLNSMNIFQQLKKGNFFVWLLLFLWVVTQQRDCWIKWQFYLQFFKKSPHFFPQQLYQFTFALAVQKCSPFTTSMPTSVIFLFFD